MQREAHGTTAGAELDDAQARREACRQQVLDEDGRGMPKALAGSIAEIGRRRLLRRRREDTHTAAHLMLAQLTCR